MPYVNIKITREGGTTAGQKAALIKGVTDLLADVLNKSPATTMVVINEVDLPDWGIGGLPVENTDARRDPQIFRSAARRLACGDKEAGLSCSRHRNAQTGEV